MYQLLDYCWSGCIGSWRHSWFHKHWAVKQPNKMDHDYELAIGEINHICNLCVDGGRCWWLVLLSLRIS